MKIHSHHELVLLGNWLGRRMMKFQIIISFIQGNKLWDNEMAFSFSNIFQRHVFFIDFVLT